MIPIDLFVFLLEQFYDCFDLWNKFRTKLIIIKNPASGRISIEGQPDASSLTCTGHRLRLLLASVVLLFVVVAAVIPSSFLLAKQSQLSSLHSQNSHLSELNKFLQKQAENFSISGKLPKIRVGVQTFHQFLHCWYKPR